MTEKLTYCTLSDYRWKLNVNVLLELHGCTGSNFEDLLILPLVHLYVYYRVVQLCRQYEIATLPMAAKATIVALWMAVKGQTSRFSILETEAIRLA